jgi:hypothetical protein
MAFFPITSNHFDKQFSKLTRKNAVFKAQAAKKIKSIALNPEIGVPKTHKLRGLRGLHISDQAHGMSRARAGARVPERGPAACGAVRACCAIVRACRIAWQAIALGRAGSLLCISF